MKRSKVRTRTLQLRVSVRDVKPEIWRKLLVPSDITLGRLHSILQVLMGWRDIHLYAFVIDKKRYSPPTEDDDSSRRGNPTGARLSSVFAKDGKSITYEYDFGDGWQVEVCSEPKDRAFQQGQPAECIEGSRHGPVEDSGGTRGYMEKAKIYQNPHHRRYLDVRELIGPGFDPEAFDLVETNAMLRSIG